MLVDKLIWICSALILALPPVLAQEARPGDAPPDLFRAQATPAAAGNQDAAPAVDERDSRADDEQGAPDVRAGWHWAVDGRRPSLDRRTSDVGAMRFRGIRGGVGVLFEWSF